MVFVIIFKTVDIYVTTKLFKTHFSSFMSLIQKKALRTNSLFASVFLKEPEMDEDK